MCLSSQSLDAFPRKKYPAGLVVGRTRVCALPLLAYTDRNWTRTNTGGRKSGTRRLTKDIWRVFGPPNRQLPGIIQSAGEPGDRWLGHRKMAGREESPDTVVVGSQEPVTK